MKRWSCTTLALALLGGVLPAGPAFGGVFLREPPLPYFPQARDRYIAYDAVVPARSAMYDRLGQFVSYGVYGLRWSEIRDRYTQAKIDAGVGTADLSGTSKVLQQSDFFNFFTAVRHSYNGRHMSMAVGRNLSTTFTPLVLNSMTFGGLRVDYGSPRHDLTLLLSRGGSLEASLLYSRLRGDQRGFEELSPVIVTGANWRGRFGALEVGTTFFRQLQSNIKSNPRSLVRGDVPYPEFRSPKMIKVRVTDDSPRDLGGAAVYGAQIFLRGTADSTELLYTSAPDRAGPAGYSYQASLAPNFAGGRAVGSHYEADGAEEGIVITFDLQGLYQVQPDLVIAAADFELMVEGDYRIGMRQLYDFELPGGALDTSRAWPFNPTGQFSLDQFQDHLGQEEMYFTVRRAEGSPAMEGPRVVRFKHSIPTAQSFYGLNVNWLSEHFHLTGELALNPQDFKFPTARGRRLRQTSKAGYLTLQGKMGAAGQVGAEVFRIEPTYGGGYDSRRGGLVLHTDVRELQGGVENAVVAMTQEFRAYDDNDDHDNWPDDYPGSADVLYMARGAFERPTFPSSRPEGGVYPGLDLNGDFVLDHDKNRNAVEDYLEPFLGYDADPPEFVYGLDLNNNLVPDFRENDDEPDYPYRRDQQGTQLFYDLTSRPWWLNLARLGWYRSTELVGGHRMNAVYGRVGLSCEAPEFWLSFNDDLKRVHDNIPDDTYRVILVFDPGGAGTRDAVALSQRYNQPSPPLPDFLPMRNSLVNTAHLDSRWLPLPGLQVGNSFNYTINRKFSDEDRPQAPGTWHNFSMVNKASYTREVLPKLKATARVKHLLAKWDEGSYVPVDTLGTYRFVQEAPGDDGAVRLDTVAVPEGAASWSLLTPEVVFSYELTPRTHVEFGQHGLFAPGLQGRYIDRRLPAKGYTENVSLLQLTMEGAYGGYRMVSTVGLRRAKADLNRHALAADTDFTSFFVDVIFSPE
ncbi:MAG: hypothetical protein HYW07_07970 [Candidatus Latescibacteria bacterium]|nr:hypothetical protein [Candidatus Latescibacterota bacterium]